ncbi:MAG: transglycosylase domain-containing protein [Arenimonas sp.]|uniref:biosynthetic peptidoglycan transglycosylase n=1 Tax=Arenimonas sp. TaxID=1872635 RepID=UPI0025BF9B86|nr:biosynthetic peptidoglycan transglycosylase [Arenimonas sp.]MBW8368692.1 transglycosylase domain-containing protein [Arenimonas sp.]
MVRKYLKAAFIGMCLLLPVYLLIAFLWANSVADELLMATPSRGQATQIHPRHVRALVMVEDPAFYEHAGLDISKGQGVTSITSVLARDLFLGKHQVDGTKGAMQSFYRGVFNCCRKIDFGRDVMALVLDARVTKQQQLDMYVGSTYFGSLDGKAVVGFEAAANGYYGKDLSRLTDREFYGLMAMPIAPNRYHPLRNPELHAERAKRIEALVNGKCEASGWLDLTYEECATDSAKTTTPSSSA